MWELSPQVPLYVYLNSIYPSVCVYVCACVHACVRACVCERACTYEYVCEQQPLGRWLSN